MPVILRNKKTNKTSTFDSQEAANKCMKMHPGTFIVSKTAGVSKDAQDVIDKTTGKGKDDRSDKSGKK